MKDLLPTPPATPTRAEVIGIAFLTAVGLIVRIIAWKHQSIVSIDGALHLQLASHLSGSGLEDSGFPYGYAVLSMITTWITQDAFNAAKVVALIFGTLLIPISWRLTRCWTPSMVLRFLPAVAVAFLPITVRYSVTSMPVAPLTALLLVSFLAVIYRKGRAGGILAGLAFAFRPDVWPVLVLTGGYLAWAKSAQARRYLIAAAVVVGAYCVAHLAHRGGLDLLAPEAQWVQSIDFSQDEHDIKELSGLVNTGRMLWLHGGYLVPLAALAGVFLGGWFLGAGLVGLLISTLFKPSVGAAFIFPMIPLVLILAAVALSRVRAAPLRTALAVFAAGLLTFSAAKQVVGYTLNENGVYRELTEAGLWLKDHVEPGKVIYSSSPLSAYYAGGSHRWMPEGDDYHEIVGQIVVNQGDLVVAHQLNDPEESAAGILARDKLVALFDPRLSPLYVDDRFLDGRTAIYRVVRDGGIPELPVEADKRTYAAKLPHGPDHELHAVLATASEDYWVAANEYLYAIRAYPQDPRLADWYYKRANALGAIGKENELEMADAAIRKALDIEPENPEYLGVLIKILRALGRDRAAEYWQSKLDDLGGASN